jgi:uncharacterized SAM-binding protein YcdF (DUF218 family)
MKKIIIAAFLVVAGIIVALSIYLAPNDLSSCTTHPTGIAPCGPADAIVAVSGGDTIARTKEAIKLYQNGWAPLLIFSGAAQDKSGPSNAEAMRREARAEGVPDSAILMEQESTTTKQNAENTENIFTQNKITSVILVTSGYHQRRAGLEFKQATNVSVRNHPVASDDQWSSTWWLTPIGWFLAISEITKILIFYVGGSR